MIHKEYDKDITGMNTFRMKVKCRLFIEYDSADDLEEIDFGTLPRPLLHIGGGSNLLFSGDFGGTVLHSAVKYFRTLPDDNPQHIGLRSPSEAGQAATQHDGNAVLVSAGAGVKFDDFCSWTAERNLWGAENLSHIPGEVGAAAVQNIGAYGVEASDIIHEVHCFDIIGHKSVIFSTEECGYGYRDSIFKKQGTKGRYIVTEVIFALSRKPMPRLDYGHVRKAVEEACANMVCSRTIPSGGVEEDDMRPEMKIEEIITPAIIRQVITGMRKDKLPEVSEIGSAGSFFKNPVVPESVFRHVCEVTDGSVPHYITETGIKIPAAWLIERCGWKGYCSGNAGVYSRQPLVIINATGQASPQEIIGLKDRITASVQEHFGITLFPEVEII